MMRSIAVAAVGMLASCMAVGQEAAIKPEFEVASVKRSPPQERAYGDWAVSCSPGGRIYATSYTLRMLIHDAYDAFKLTTLWVDPTGPMKTDSISRRSRPLPQA